MGASDSSLSDMKEYPDVLKCCNCKELLTILPIYFDINTGNICGRCPQILNNECYQNTALEAMIKLQKLPCRYKKNGCSDTFNDETVKNHELICTCRQYSCPSIPLHCPWKGTRSEMKAHYEEKHKDALMQQDNFLYFVLNKQYEQNVLIETMKKQFLFHVRYENKVLHCGLIYFEKPNEKKKYVFTLVFKNGERKYEQIISNMRFLDTYLISNKELYEFNFDEIDVLVKNSRTIDFQISVIEKTKEE